MRPCAPVATLPPRKAGGGHLNFGEKGTFLLCFDELKTVVDIPRNAMLRSSRKGGFQEANSSHAK